MKKVKIRVNTVKYSDSPTSLSIIPNTKGSDKTYWSFESTMKAVEDEEVWFVYVIYSSGSTFGTAYGNRAYVDVFDSKKEAKACVEKIYEHEKAYKDDKSHSNSAWTVKYKKDGKNKTVHANWVGYFESIEDVGCRHLEIVSQYNRNT